MSKTKIPGILCTLLLLALSGCANTGTGARPGSAGHLTLLTEEYPPLSFMADGEITGQATEVVKALMERTGTGKTIRMLDWEQGYRMVLEQPDTALFSTAMTPERKNRLQWVGPITALDTNLYALKGSKIRISTLDEAKRAGSIATVAGYYTGQVLAQQGFGNLQTYADEAAAVRKLLAGEVPLFVGSNTAMPAVLAKLGASMADVESVFTVSTDLAYIAFSPATSPELVASWQRKLDDMKRDGSFRKIYAKWLPGEVPPGLLQLMTEQYPPITFIKDGQPAGLVTDMVREITRRIGLADAIRLTAWKNAYNMALLHPNVVLFSAERTPERETLFHWVGPVGQNSALLFAKKGAGISLNSLDDARAVKAIATTTDWFTEQHLKREGFTNLLSAKDPADNVRQLMNGEAQLSIFTDVTIPEIVKAAGYRMDDLQPVLTVSRTGFYIAISRDTPPETVKAWQAALDELKRDGTFEAIYRRYLPHADLTGLLP
jgi:polar amino acid transport system substrate-binding protein